MKLKMACVLAWVLALAIPAVWAQQSGSDGPKYDTSTVTTIKGEVVKSGTSGLLGLGGDEQVEVRTDTESLPVILGPRNFLDSQNVKVEKGDKVTVTGSRILIDDKPTIIAQEVKKSGNQVLTLRAADGTPAWTQPMGVATPEQQQGQTGSGQQTGTGEQGGAMSGQPAAGTETGGTQGTTTGGMEGGAVQGCPTPMATPTAGMGQEQ